MGLENLKSIFTEGLSQFESTSILDNPQNILPNLDSPEYFDMIRMPNIKLYDTYNYDPRSDIKIKNPYKGTKFDDGIAGVFPNPYSVGFNSINSPLGYSNSPTGNDIIEMGNTSGVGYLNKKPLMELYIGTKNKTPDKYYQNGGINLSRTIVQNSILSYNGNLNINPEFLDSSGIKDSQNIQDLGWQALYTNNHRPKDPFGGYNYENAFIDTDNLKIRAHSGDSLFNGTDGVSRTSIVGGGEPYIISNIPRSNSDAASGRTVNMTLLGRSVPIVRALTDVVRLTSFIASPAGVAFIAKQNIHTVVNTNVVRRKDEDDSENRKKDYLVRVPQRFQTGYNPFSTILSAGSRLLGIGRPNVAWTRREGIGSGGAVSKAIKEWEQFKPGGGARGDTNRENISDALDGGGGDVYGVGTPGVEFSIHDTFNQNDGSPYGLPSPENEIESSLFNKFKGAFGVDETVTKISTGDKMTLARMISGLNLEFDENHTQGKLAPMKTDLDQFNDLNIDIEEQKNGMPFYFKDLRDNTYIFFRAFLDGLNENVTASWSPIDYIGRSESVYTYSKGERVITCQLKLFAQTADELEAIYQKLNRLTSMCYPEYKEDVNMNNKIRMKPPLVKMRLGELYGSQNNEVTGFFQNVTYDFPSEGAWEIEKGKRVPKYIICSFTYTVIHSEAPSLKFAKSDESDNPKDKNFYGITNTIGTGEPKTFV